MNDKVTFGCNREMGGARDEGGRNGVAWGRAGGCSAIGAKVPSARRPVNPAPEAFLESFQPRRGGQFGIASKAGFSFCIAPCSSISIAAHQLRRFCFFMIVCSCNVLTDHDVRSA